MVPVVRVKIKLEVLRTLKWSLWSENAFFGAHEQTRILSKVLSLRLQKTLPNRKP